MDYSLRLNRNKNAATCRGISHYCLVFFHTLFFLFLSYTAFPQVSGRIIDAEAKTPIKDALISDNLGNIVLSEADGRFSLPADTISPDSVRVEYTGYKSETIVTAREKSPVNIELSPVYHDIEEVVITSPAINTRLKYSSGPVGLLSAGILAEGDDISLSGFMNRMPGVYMATGAYNTNRLIIRGIGSRTPYSTNRIRAYYGEIPLTSGDGTTSLEDIDIASIGRIEVIRGPSSAVYGSGLGGVVKILPFQQTGKGTAVTAGFQAGSFASRRGLARAGYRGKRFSMSALYSHTKSGGYRQNSSYLRNSLFLNGNIYGTRSQIRILLAYAGINAHIPSSIDYRAFMDHPDQAAPGWLAVRGFEKSNRLLGGLTFTRYFGKSFSNKFTLFSSASDHYESRPFNILDDNAFSVGLREKIGIVAGRFQLDAGTEIYTEEYNWQIYETLSGSRGNLVNNYSENRSYINIFGHSETKISDNLRFEAGINFNILRYKLDNQITPDVYPATFRYRPVISPRTGLNFHFLRQIFFYSSVGHGFSAPSLEETLLPEGEINPDLKPEQGWNYNLGSRGYLLSRHIYYDICFYYIRLRNLIVTKRLSEDTFTGINAGKTGHYGVELFLKAAFFSPDRSADGPLVLRSSITLSRNRFLQFTDNGTDYSGKNLPGIPEGMLNLDAEFNTGHLPKLYLSFNLTGRQYMDDANSLSYASWKTVDLKVSWDVPVAMHKVRSGLYFGIRNIFNEKYASMILVNARSFGNAPPRYYYPGLPVNFYFGIKIRV